MIEKALVIELGAALEPASADPLVAENQAAALRAALDNQIDDVQAILDRWCARRHESVRAAFEFDVMCLRKAVPADIVDGWTDWLQGAVQRLSEDVGDQLELCLVVAGSCGAGVLAPAGPLDENSRDAPDAAPGPTTAGRPPAKTRSQ